MIAAGSLSHLSREQADRLRALAVQLGPFSLPLVDAALAGRIELAIPFRNHRAPLDVMRRATLPVVAWIGDDDDRSTGPDGWRCAHAVTRWARAGLVHGAGGERRHYQAAVEGAEAHGRFTLVETSSRHASAWASLLPGKPVLIVVPRGGEHPLPGRREIWH